MKIVLREITARDLVAGCHDDGDGGVVGDGGAPRPNHHLSKRPHLCKLLLSIRCGL